MSTIKKHSEQELRNIVRDLQCGSLTVQQRAERAQALNDAITRLALHEKIYEGIFNGPLDPENPGKVARI